MIFNFRRYENKYLISGTQCALLEALMSPHMEADPYGEYLVQNLYLDTEAWDLCRISTEGPLYKEKMRLRSYNGPGGPVFLELKKKYKGMVYKTRAAFPLEDTSIGWELSFCLKRNPLTKKLLIGYRRMAYREAGSGPGGDLRITFDRDIHYRVRDLDFSRPQEGKLLVPSDQVLMEIKTAGGIPLYLTRILSQEGIFPMPFSKVGRAYKDHWTSSTTTLA
ncbi:MAG: polyphosphate polymerase domain-containing protein [Treponema sp.]|nr:polyphosphate polymerase domain-containing protein [Treponema sp.]